MNSDRKSDPYPKLGQVRVHCVHLHAHSLPCRAHSTRRLHAASLGCARSVTRRPERVYKYQVSHYSILEAKVGNDKFPGFMFVNKGKIVISKKDMYSINKLEMGHSRN